MSNKPYRKMPESVMFETERQAIEVADEYAERNNLYRSEGRNLDSFYRKELPLVGGFFLCAYSRKRRDDNSDKNTFRGGESEQRGTNRGGRGGA